MTLENPSIQFFDGISEELSGVSLRRSRRSGVRTVMMTFTALRSIERFNSFRNRFSQAMRRTDSEGEISIEPDSVKFVFGGPEGDDFERMECQFKIDREDHWERFMRFMNRYAEANEMAYGESEAQS